MNKQQIEYMKCVERLDDIHLGMLAPSTAVKYPHLIMHQCLVKGWIFISGWNQYWKWPEVSLSTKGMRALRSATNPPTPSQEE